MSVRYENVEMAALAEPERRAYPVRSGLRGALLSAERTLWTEPVPVGGCAAVLSLHTVTRCAPWFAPGLVSGWWLSQELNSSKGLLNPGAHPEALRPTICILLNKPVLEMERVRVDRGRGTVRSGSPTSMPWGGEGPAGCGPRPASAGRAWAVVVPVFPAHPCSPP